MGKNIRRILFWLLFLLFLVTTPVAILYSQGYRFDQRRMIFVHSGAITIKSLPASVNLYLDGKPQPVKSLDIINNSMTIGGLRPGTYHIQASLEGYSDWDKKVEIHSGLSTEFWNVVLAPRNPKISEVASQDPARFFLSPLGKKIAFLEDLERGVSLWVTDIKKNESHSIYSNSNVSFPNDKLENVEWNYKETSLLLPIMRENGKDYLIASDEGEFEPFYLSDIAKIQNIQQSRWSPKEKDVIYFRAKEDGQKSSSLYKISLEDKVSQFLIADTSAFDLSQDSIYYLQSNNILFKSNLDGSGNAQVNDNPFSSENLGDSTKLIVYDDARQAVIAENRDLFIHNSGSQNIFEKIASDVKGVQFSDDGKKILFWNSNEISVLFLRKWEVQPYREEGEIQTVIRLSSPIENVFWFRDYEHIFFSAKNKIKLIELDPRDRRICLDIFENNLDEFPAAYDLKNGYYYFISDSNGNKKTSYFILPEKTGILGL